MSLRLAEMIDLATDTAYEVKGEREVAGQARIRPSRLGLCQRAHYLGITGAPVLVPPDDLARRKFDVGHVWSWIFKLWFEQLGILQEAEYEIVDAELEMGAHVDFIVGGQVQKPPKEVGERERIFCDIFGWREVEYVAFRNRLWTKVLAAYGKDLPPHGVELKSVQSGSFWWAKKRDEPVAGRHQLVQAGAYDLLMRRKGIALEWSVLSVSKDDLSMAQTFVQEEHRIEAEKRARSLLSALKGEGPIPDCTCFEEFNGKGYRYCSYYGGTPVPRTDRKPEPDGPCCVVPVREVVA